MSDAETMWELDTLVTLKNLPGWKALSDRETPKIIGPDRATLIHSMNVLNSFSGSVAYIRPAYEDYIDIFGSQSRYIDSTATKTNYLALSNNGVNNAWCTMCSQEWYRQVGMPLGGADDGRRLLGPRVSSGFWSDYD